MMKAKVLQRPIALLLVLVLALGLFMAIALGAETRAEATSLKPLLVQSVSGNALTEGDAQDVAGDYRWVIEGDEYQLYIFAEEDVVVIQNPDFTAADNSENRGLRIYVATASKVTFDGIVTKVSNDVELYAGFGIEIGEDEDYVANVAIEDCIISCGQIDYYGSYIEIEAENCKLSIKDTQLIGLSEDDKKALQVYTGEVELALENVSSTEMFLFEGGDISITLTGTNSIKQARPAPEYRDDTLWNAMCIATDATVTFTAESTGELELVTFGATALGGTTGRGSAGSGADMGTLIVKGGQVTTQSYADEIDEEDEQGHGIGAGFFEDSEGEYREGRVVGINISGGTVDANSDALARIGCKNKGYTSEYQKEFRDKYAQEKGYDDWSDAANTIGYEGKDWDAWGQFTIACGNAFDKHLATLPVFIITGGSVVAKGVVGEDDEGDTASPVGYLNTRPVNSYGELLYLLKYKAAEVTAPTLVTELNIVDAAGETYEYGITGMYTDAEGYVYLWLPEGATVKEEEEPTPPTPQPDPPATPTISDLVSVDGKRVDAAKVRVDKGAATTVTVIDQSKIAGYIKKATKNVTVKVSLAKETNIAAAEMVVKTIEDMAERKLTLTIEIEGVIYHLDASAIDTKGILEALGASDSSKVQFTITIVTDVDAATRALVNAAIAKIGGEIVLPPLQFIITASYNGKTVDVSEFGAYVTRTIEITAAQAQKEPRGVVVEAEGTVRHVPTNIFEKNGKWYAKISSLTNSTYVLIFNQVAFPDAAGKWYEAIVNEAGSRKIVSGLPNGDFCGDSNITRAEFAQIIINALGLPAKSGTAGFDDVGSGDWFAGAVGTAYKYSLISGVGGGKFEPQRNITRQEAMVLIYNAAQLAGFKGSTSGLSAFADAGEIADWASDAAAFCVGSGLVQGDNGLLRPTESISRAETAAIVLRLLQQADLVNK